MRCLFVGPLANHAVIGRVAAFTAAGFDVFLVDASSVDINWLQKGYPIKAAKIVDFWNDPFFRERPSPYVFLKEYLRTFRLLPEEIEISNHLNKLLQDVQPDFFVTHYGAYAIHLARILKRLAPKTPVIDIVNLLPSTFNFYNGMSRYLRGWMGRLEQLNYKKFLRHIDGVIYANQLMYEYANKTYHINRSHSFILPDYLPASFFADNVNNTNINHRIEDENPKVIFLGAPERYGNIIDSLDQHFLELAGQNIHVFSGKISEKVRTTGFGHAYPYFSNEAVFCGRLASYAKTFDASLIAYNLPKRQERFRTTYPTRLFTAITAGLPIAVRGGYFDACEHFVKKHEIGFVYNNPIDLRNKLENLSIIQKYRNNLRSMKESMTAESQAGSVRNIVYSII